MAKMTSVMRAREAAFLEWGGKGPAASPAGALDDSFDTSIIEDLREWLKSKLTPEDQQRFEAIVLGAKPDEAFDEPAFPGRPSPGGQVAALDGLPEMLRNRVFAAMSQPLRSRAINAIVKQRASAEADLAKRFPAFGRIKVIP